MRYYSTKDTTRPFSLRDAVLMGLPPDNGLFMPERIPVLPSPMIKAMRSMSLPEIASIVAKAWFGDELPAADLETMCRQAYPFDTPLVRLRDQTCLLELFHGPTLAFKDVGARFMARLMAYLNRDENQKLTILVATSGDTGSAVASGFWRVPGIEVVILYPSGKVSEWQEKQLTTWGDNIRALEIDGTFDDCQRLVKEAFLDDDLRSMRRLSSANSISIARLVPQIFYYFRAVAQLPEDAREPVFVVPSGNFGNLTAGVMAWKMGLGVHRFVAATNSNDVFPAYLQHGQFIPRPSVATISNAMDVGHPSNFWRMTALFDNDHERLRNMVEAYAADEPTTARLLRSCWDECHYLTEPHAAVGLFGWEQYVERHGTRHPGIVLGTAHPAKFRDSVEAITGQSPEVPPSLAEVIGKEKSATRIRADYSLFKRFLLESEQ
jgi:threonine synthase